MAEHTPLQISVVVATYNRHAALQRLLRDLGQQDLAADQFEVVVVDDGSTPPASEACRALELPYPITYLAQANAGPAAARHRGAQVAQGEILVVVDDDMELGPGFLSAHLRAHQAGAEVVFGLIAPAPEFGTMPLFERFHAEQVLRLARQIRSGRIRLKGIQLCSGNVSIRRRRYLEVGGFDASIPRSEDRELGIRLEKAGARLAFAIDAEVVHHTDHTVLERWLSRAFEYGLWDARIAAMHQDVESADPWRYLFLVNHVSRPLLLGVVALPVAAKPLARGLMVVAGRLDRLGLQRPALAGTTLAYGVEYFHGLREASGSLGGAVHGLRHYLDKRRAAAPPSFLGALRADHASLRRNRSKYHADRVSPGQLPVHVVTKVGVQMLAAVRLMQALRRRRLPLLPQVTSRLIRHLYGAEIHWDADIAPGISVVHGNGLVISHAARVGEGCILFHNVTLGEGLDPVTRVQGAPTLEPGVHVGPGATLLGPITVGAGSKIMAGVVLTESVPANSVVTAPRPEVRARAAGGRGGGRDDDTATHDSSSAVAPVAR
ncbi:MAG: glycosyltransferase [Pseudomonadota bacterium]